MSFPEAEEMAPEIATPLLKHKGLSSSWVWLLALRPQHYTRKGSDIAGACWLPAQHQAQWETLSQGNKVESDRAGRPLASLCTDTHSTQTGKSFPSD